MRKAWRPDGLRANSVAPSGRVNSSWWCWNQGPPAISSTEEPTFPHPYSGRADRVTCPPKAADMIWAPKQMPSTGTPELT